MKRKCESCLEEYWFGRKRLCPRCSLVATRLAKAKVIKAGDYEFIKFVNRIK